MALSSPDLGPRWYPGPPRLLPPPKDGIDRCRGSPPAAFSCYLFCCPWCLGQGPCCRSPHTRDGPRVCRPPTTHTRLLCPFPVTPHRADPSCATGLQHPTPPFSEIPSVAVAVLGIFAFFLIVTGAWARRQPVQTTAIVLRKLTPFHQCFFPLGCQVRACLWQMHLQIWPP